MKKLLLLCFVFILIQNNANSKDYAQLHIKEMEKSQNFSTSKSFFKGAKNINIPLSNQNIEIKDPNLIKLSGYNDIPENEYKIKTLKDEKEYAQKAKYFATKEFGIYKNPIYSEDFYKLYRITERIIRANNLDFINWRIQLIPKEAFNAYSSETNCITIYTGAFDTLRDNDAALALLIGHELAHSLLGHNARKQILYSKMKRLLKLRALNPANLSYLTAQKKILLEDRKMEYTADIEGAKLALKAGYDLESAKETISFINTFGYYWDINASHPSPEKRLENYEINKKYFFNEEWKKQGRYNIYISDVLDCKKSSKRNSFTILRNEKRNENEYYRPENASEIYLRFGYKSYTNREFKNAIKYFKKHLKYAEGNYAVYLYISYCYENLYLNTNKKLYLKQAQKYANKANLLDNNKYTQGQISNLNNLL